VLGSNGIVANFQATGQAGANIVSGGAFNPYMNWYSSGSTLEASIFAVAGAGAFAIGTGASGTERMRLDASGNLGLGVTPSAWASLYKSFDVAKASSHYGFWDGATSIAGLANGAFVNSSYSWAYAISGQAVARYAQEGDGAHKWFTAPSGTAGNAISFTQALTLTAASNLLLGGTNDPGGANAFYIANTASVPGTPTSGGVLYVESGALKYKGSSGTVTTIANA
jgi:hypothetical protein